MAPSIPVVAALLSVSSANRAEINEGSSMLQMPVTEVNLAVDQDADECRCPGYVEADCTAEAAQGCVWSSIGSSNGPWCQCLNAPVDPIPAPAPPPAPLPAATTTTTTTVDPIPSGWTMIFENWNCEGSGSSSNEYSPTAATNEECAQACGAEGHIIAGFWHNPDVRPDVCRCYDSCDAGGATGSTWPNTVMQKEFILASTDMKCPLDSGDRLFRSPAEGSSDVSLAACHLECQNTETCAHFSWGQVEGGNVCMGCTTLQNEQVHVGFNTYDMEHSTPPVQMLNNWNFESMTADGVEATLEEGKWIHFLNNGNSGLTNTDIPGWHQMGSGAGASGLFNSNNNEIAAEGSHVLFLNSGDDNNYVYQDLLLPFEATINIEAAVCGGNGGNDGGYRFGLYSEDGTLLQEEVAGVNGAPLCNGNQYIVTHMSISVGDHPAMVGQTLQLRLMKNRSAQAHYHYIRFT